MDVYLIRTQRSDYRESRELAIFRIDDAGHRAIASPLVFTEIGDNPVSTPTIGISADAEGFLQACLDHAWDIGLRPAGFLDTKRETAALNAHLHDMRALVFKASVTPKA